MKRTGSNLEASYAASKKPHIGYQKSYYLFVGEQLLVRVGNEPVEEEKEEREQSILLEAIKKATRYPVCSIDLPENFFQEIRAGNPDVLIESLKKSIAFYFNGLRGYDIAHYCILGQWFQAAKYVIDDKKLDRSDHYYMAIAAMVGNVKVFDYIEQKQTQFALIMKIAKRFGNAKFMHVLTGHYKREEQRKIDEAAAQNKRISIPATDTIYKLPPLEAVIPSLRTVCAHVIAAETLRHPTFLVPRLATLPSELFTLVCLQIAEDGERGCRALMQIQTINPSLVNLVYTDKHRIVKWEQPGGNATTLAGKAGVSGYKDGPCKSARFSDPLGIAINQKSGTVFISEGKAIRVIELTTGEVSTLTGSQSTLRMEEGQV